MRGREWDMIEGSDVGDVLRVVCGGTGGRGRCAQVEWILDWMMYRFCRLWCVERVRESQGVWLGELE